MKQQDARKFQSMKFESWLAWLALRHFLPASYSRELSIILIEKVSEGSLTLSDLFDEKISSEELAIQSWLVRPRCSSNKIAEYLQTKVRVIAGQFDETEGSYLYGFEDIRYSKLVDFAIVFGSKNFSDEVTVEELLELTEDLNFVQFVKSWIYIQTAVREGGASETLKDVVDMLSNVPEPLLTVMLKHMGDLLRLSDLPNDALAYYDECEFRLCRKPKLKLSYSKLLLEIVEQSRASLYFDISDDHTSYSRFVEWFDEKSLQKSPLVVANAGLDAFVSKAKVSPRFRYVDDTRPIFMLPPLMSKSHSRERALSLKSRADFSEANVEFWAIIRRQAALGLSYELNQTKGHWGRALIEWLSFSEEAAPDLFTAAVRMLIEAGELHFISNLKWAENFVDRYVTSTFLRELIADFWLNRKNRTQQKILVELMTEWILRISSDREVGEQLMSALVEISGIDISKDGDSDDELFQSALAALKKVAKFRPDLRKASAGVADRIVQVVHTGEFYSLLKALDLANLYSQTFDKVSVRKVFDAISLMLQRESAVNMGWPVLRAAFDYIGSTAVKSLIDNDEIEAGDIVELLLRICGPNDSEHTAMLMHLKNLTPSYLTSPGVVDRLMPALHTVRLNAKRINASNSIPNIQVLLGLPLVVGEAGVLEAISTATDIVASSQSKSISINLGSAYRILSQIRLEAKALSRSLNIDEETFINWVRPLWSSVKALWDGARSSSAAFSGFSFVPQKKPNDTVVHNWALETLAFSDLMREGNEIRELLAAVALENNTLRDGIRLAFATFTSVVDDEPIDLLAIQGEEREQFYSALGRRLVTLSRREDSDLYRTLCERCLVLGPRPDDAAVFVLVRQFEPRSVIRFDLIVNYEKRLAEHNSLRQLILPLLVGFKSHVGKADGG